MLKQGAFEGSFRAWFVVLGALAAAACSVAVDAPVEESSVDAPVASDAEPILNGGQQTFGILDRNATVRIRNRTSAPFCGGGIGMGTGVLIENDIVLTARHVVGAFTSGCTSPSRFSPAAPGGDLFVYAQNFFETPPTCSVEGCANVRVGRVLFPPNNLDVALLFLTRPIRGNDQSTLGHHVPIYPYDPLSEFGQPMFIYGYGRSTCGETITGISPLRVGSAIPTSSILDLVEFLPNSSGQLGAPGDSGSAAWSSRTSWPYSAYGVFSNSLCGINGRYVSPDRYRFWARLQIAASKPTLTYLFGTGSTISEPFWRRDDPASSPVASNWFLSNGRLWETTNVQGRIAVGPFLVSNYPDGAILFPRDEVHDNVDVSINVQSSTGTGAAGIVFRYVDDTHYYLFTVRKSSGVAAFYKRDGSTWTTLGSVSTAAANWAQAGGVNLRVLAQDRSYAAFIGTTALFTVQDSRYPVGRVGIYKFALPDASFDTFSFRPLAPTTSVSWPLP